MRNGDRARRAAKGRTRSLLAHPHALAAAGVVLAVCAFQLWTTPSNPPGFHRDEVALALNAHTLSTELRDEDGARTPLFFRSFGDYKSPLYPYLLAGVFAVTGPGKQVARTFSAVLVLAAVLLLGLLAYRLSGSWLVAVVVLVLAGLTPWLFELGRVALEASTQPLLVVLLLLWLLRCERRTLRSARAGAVAGLLLALLTYSYTGSRLLGPLLAGALVLFAGRERARWLAGAWGAFAVALLPLGAYALRHPGALTARYEATTIARDDASPLRIVAQALSNWVHDVNLWHWATAGDPAPYVHVTGYGSVFAAVALLALAGAAVVLRGTRRAAHVPTGHVPGTDPWTCPDGRWWRYVLAAALLAPVPAALTVDRFNAIRLATLPVFLAVLAVPALGALLREARRRRLAQAAVAVLAVSVVFQFWQFLDRYTSIGPGRTVLFEAGVEPLLERAFAGGGPVYVDFDDRGAQAQARWHAALAGLPRDRVVVLPDGGIPPVGATVFLHFQDCDFACAEVERWELYRVARALGPPPAPTP
ncbi:MAG TPA: glycosyltransferase family 39 protein [Gaiellaceae bacterium]|nr:glycosyltransferase family 39 protein [Gaiellaceae bacterium]